jgi:hypothetical protein
MQKRLNIAPTDAAATFVLGGAGAIAAANTGRGPIRQGPTSDVLDVPGPFELPEPGDISDAQARALPTP